MRLNPDAEKRENEFVLHRMSVYGKRLFNLVERQATSHLASEMEFG